MGAEGAQAGVTYAPPVEASGSGGASLVTQVRTRLAKISAEPATVFGVWVLMALVFGFINSKFWTSANFLAIGEAAAPLALVSLGQSVILIAGEFDLSVGGAVGLGGVVFVELSNGGIPTWAAAVLAIIIIGGGLGLINGIATNVLKINALIATLATLAIVEAIANILSNGLSVPASSTAVGALALPTVGTVPGYIWLIVVLFVAGMVVLARTVTGRSLYVLGGNRVAAKLAGLRTRQLTIGAFVICAMAAVVAGIVQASLLTAGDPSAGGSSLTLLSITAVVLGGGSLAGGSGGLGGTLVGVFLLGTLTDGLAITYVPSFYDGLVTGAVLLLAVGASSVRRSMRMS